MTQPALEGSPCSGSQLLQDRLLRRGAAALQDAELLALWLQLEDPGLAEQLLADDAALLGRGRAGLPVAGLTPEHTARLVAAEALMERLAGRALEAGPVLSSSAEVRRFLRFRLAGRRREIFACLFLDSRHQLLRFEELFAGTVDRASVHPREVLRRALELNAAAVIAAHNHPSGVAEPSVSDITLTEDLAALLRRIDVRLLDHLVVGRGREVSLAERGFLRV
ncbi:MAG: DNA repair protein RadC [Pseudomonadota bacterium]